MKNLDNKYKYKYIIGIDPGSCGALVIINSECTILLSQKYNNGSEYIDILKNYDQSSIVILEHVHSMYHDGKKQAFSFGRYRGQIEGICLALGIPYICDERTEPSVWKDKLGVTSDKETSIHKAMSINPDIEHCMYEGMISRGKNKGQAKYNDNVAEAFLLAYYGLKVLET